MFGMIKDILAQFFPTENMLPHLLTIPSKLFSFKDYSLFMYVALALYLVILVGCLLFGIFLLKRGSYCSETHGTLMIIIALLDGPMVLLSLGGYLGSFVWIAAVISVIFYIVCQTIVDSDKVGMNSLFCIGIVVFGGFFVFWLSSGETTDEINLALLNTLPLGATVSAIIGILMEISWNFSRRPSYVRSSSSRDDTPYSYTPTYSNIFDARDHLRAQLDQPHLSETEKERIVKEHNDKYLDNVRLTNGIYYDSSSD